MTTKTIYYIGAILALVLAGCSSDDGLLSGPVATGEGDAIVLDVKEVVSVVTRADQQTGSMTFETLKTTGFGVYGYEGAGNYNSSSSAFNLFAPNTHVTFVSDGTAPTTSLDIPGSWDYTNANTANLKEWDSSKKYTFFAYAPYMSAGEGTYGTDAGINTISTGDGDPTINYTVATDPAKSVDLLWGVRTDTSEKTGKPWIDLTQGQTTSAVLFTFYHALCALGLHAQVMVDQGNDTDNLGDVSTLGTLGDKDGCKVTLRKITIEPAGTPATGSSDAVAAEPFCQSGVLNLNNTSAHQPLWQSTSGTITSLAIDNGTEGHGTIDSKLLDPVANTTNDDYYTPETTDLNQNGTKTNVMANNSVPGITETANTQTVIKDDNLFMLIPPQAAQDYTITVEYYITYKTTGMSYHRQSFRGSATIKNLKLAAGVKYYLNLVFGLTTFKVTVTANDWEETTNAVTIATETGTSASNSLAK